MKRHTNSPVWKEQFYILHEPNTVGILELRDKASLTSEPMGTAELHFDDYAAQVKNGPVEVEIDFKDPRDKPAGRVWLQFRQVDFSLNFWVCSKKHKYHLPSN